LASAATVLGIALFITILLRQDTRHRTS